MGRGGPVNMGRVGPPHMGQPGYGTMAANDPAMKTEGGGTIRNMTGLLGAAPGPSQFGGARGATGGPPKLEPLMKEEDSYAQEDMDIETSEERDLDPSGRFGGPRGRNNRGNSFGADGEYQGGRRSREGNSFGADGEYQGGRRSS